MKQLRMLKILILFSALILAVTSPALALSIGPEPAVEWGTTINFYQDREDDTVGFSFKTKKTLWVTHLGVFDDLGNGLLNSHEVGLWDTSRNLLASTNFVAGTPGRHSSCCFSCADKSLHARQK